MYSSGIIDFVTVIIMLIVIYEDIFGDQLTAHSVFVHIFSSWHDYFIDSRRNLLSMYLPQEAHKSLVDLLSFVFGENKKGLDSSVFTFRENH